jgi:hypothetical protein
VLAYFSFASSGFTYADITYLVPTQIGRRCEEIGRRGKICRQIGFDVSFEVQKMRGIGNVKSELGGAASNSASKGPCSY